MCFPMMAPCPDDLEGARIFAEVTQGMSEKEVAVRCEVPASLVTRWRERGNVPEARIDKLPADVRRRYAELRAERRGAIVLRKDPLEYFLDLVGFRLAPVKASLAPAMVVGTLSGRQERLVEKVG